MELMSSSSEDESESNQENDQQMSDDSFEEMYDMDTELFTQENYLFLFDKHMKFSQREDFDITKDLKPQDYVQMKKINRNELYEFLNGLRNQAGVDEQLNADQKITEIVPINMLNKSGDLDDELLKNIFTKLLGYLNFGFYLINIVSHLEYFMNTLTHDLKRKTANPFDAPEKYPAFNFKVNELSSKNSLVDIIEEQEDDLIDNTEIIAGVQNLNITPTDPNKKATGLIGSANVTPVDNKVSMPKLSIKQHFKRQSMIIVQRLSVLEQHKMLINPLSFSNKLKGSVMSSAGKDSDVYLKSQSIGSIKSKKITQKLVRNSISQILGNQWYPNLGLNQTPVGYK